MEKIACENLHGLFVLLAKYVHYGIKKDEIDVVCVMRGKE
jgi:hypothetical protein